MSNIGLLNTKIGVAVVLAAIELPTAVWLLTSFFQSIPIEIEESAMLDGASMVGGFVRVVVPSVLNQSKSARTVTIALTMFETETYTPWHIISAAAIIASVPLIIVVLLLQKRIVSGMIEGGVKG